MKEIRNIRSVKGEAKNPFRKELLEDFQVVKKREYIDQAGQKGVTNTIISRDGQEVGESRFFRYKKYDPEQFAKVFVSRVTAMWDMPKPASRVFSYILKILPKDKDTIYFDMKDCLKYTKYNNETSVWNGIRWLMMNDFVAKSDRTNLYFINPTIFFNGDRSAFVDVLIKDNKKENPNQTDLFRNTEQTFLNEKKEK